VTCGRGVQQRVVSCRLSSGVLVDESSCDSETRPHHQASCHLTTCPPPTTSTTATTTTTSTTPSTTTSTTTAATTTTTRTTTTTMTTTTLATERVRPATWRTGGWTPVIGILNLFAKPGFQVWKATKLGFQVGFGFGKMASV